MMLSSILRLRRNNILFSFFVMIGFHYLLNPSESKDAPLMATLVRLIAAASVFFMIFFLSRLKKNSIRLAYIFILICNWLIVINIPNNIYGLFLIFLFVGFGFLISMCLYSESGRGMVTRGLDFLLIFWLCSLLIQMLIYFATSEIVDLHKWLHPLSDARIGGTDLFLRFTGVLIEPGTYANWIYGVVLLRGLAGRKLFDRISLISVLSMAITLSAWGMIAAGSYLIAYIALNLKSRKIKVYRQAIMLVVIFLVFSIFINFKFSSEFNEMIKYLFSRSELTDGSGVAKIQAYQGFFDVFIRIFIFGLPINYDFCNGCLSSQDAGVAVNLAVRMGFVATALIFFLMFMSIYRRYGIIACTSLVPLIFAKYYFYEPLFWAIFGLSFLDIYRFKKSTNLIFSRTFSQPA